VLDRFLAIDPDLRPPSADAAIALLDAASGRASREAHGEPVIGGAFKGDELIEYLQLIVALYAIANRESQEMGRAMTSSRTGGVSRHLEDAWSSRTTTTS